MWSHRQNWLVLLRTIFVLCGLLSGADRPVFAADQNGEFDLYVLSLSWSPAYCAAHRDDQAQCGLDKHFGLVVHGLWPQYTMARPDPATGKLNDWPANCPAIATTTAVNASIPAAAAVWPSLGLYRHEWQTHGICSGLAPADYVDLTSGLRQRFQSPADLLPGGTGRRVDAAALRTAIVAANPGLPADGLSLFCRKNRLAEIRLCLRRDGDNAYITCPANVAQEDNCTGSLQVQGFGQ